MPIFGSDGFRCEFGTSFLTYESIARFANSLGNYYIFKGFSKPLLISKDTRQSGQIIEGILINILNFKGINTCSTGVLPTPGLSKILESGNYSLGCMITASHNPHYDNGIKLFQNDGFKIDIDAQEYIEKLMTSQQSENVSFSKKLGSHVVLESSFQKYTTALFKTIKLVNPVRNILIDCSNGAYSYGLNESLIFNNISFKSNNPNGNNINLDCGSLEPKKLYEYIKNSKNDFGIAFDGDGDRAIFVSKDYGIIETEKLAVLFFSMLLKNSKSNKIVTTEISNLALRHNIENLGGILIETPVGDRFVIDSVNNNGAIFGFEPSGHFYFPENSQSMDGMATMLHFFNLLNQSHETFNSDLLKLPHYNRIQRNFDISNNLGINEGIVLQDILTLINPQKEKFIIRKSMWDPVLRVYYDYVDVNNFPTLERIINKSLNKLLKEEI